ncbi:MAG: helix-turn-helix transcriptional regulator [Cyanobacteria bacterium P01_A01_bin.84]
MQKPAIDILDRYRELFAQMLKRFNISAKELAQEAGISEGMMSRFRQGKSDISLKNFIKILLIVPENARIWYLSQIFGQNPGNNWQKSINQASSQELAEILRIVADVYALRLIDKKIGNVEGRKDI